MDNAGWPLGAADPVRTSEAQLNHNYLYFWILFVCFALLDTPPLKGHGVSIGISPVPDQFPTQHPAQKANYTPQASTSCFRSFLRLLALPAPGAWLPATTNWSPLVDCPNVPHRPSLERNAAPLCRIRTISSLTCHAVPRAYRLTRKLLLSACTA